MEQINNGVPEQQAYWNSVLKTVGDASVFVPTVRGITKAVVLKTAPELAFERSIQKVTKQDIQDYLVGRKPNIDVNIPQEAKNTLADVFKYGTREDKVRTMGGIDVLSVKPNLFGDLIGVSESEAKAILDSMGGKVRPSAVAELPGYRETPGQSPAFGMSIKKIEPVGKLTDEIRSQVTNDIINYDATPLTVNGKIQIVNPDKEFRILQLQNKASTKSLSDAEINEARSLLETKPVKIDYVSEMKKLESNPDKKIAQEAKDLNVELDRTLPIDRQSKAKNMLETLVPQTNITANIPPTTNNISSRIIDNSIAQTQSLFQKAKKFIEDTPNKQGGFARIPFVSKKIEYPEEIQKARIAYENRKEALDNSRLARQDLRFLVDKEGRIRELGDVTTKKLSQKIEDMMAESGFRDSREYAAAIENYLEQKKSLKVQEENLKKMESDFREKKIEETFVKIRQMKRSREIASLEKSAEQSGVLPKKIDQGKILQTRKEVQQTLPSELKFSKEIESLQSTLDKETLASQLSELEDKYQLDTSYNKIIIDSSTPVKYKVGLLDYLRTPDRVLKKIGLGGVAKTLRQSYDNYLSELPDHLKIITDWSKQVSKESNQRIFKYLDGQTLDIPLKGEEIVVANEIKQYLSEWADRLGLPEDNKISHYITHVFDIGSIPKEFDEEVAKIIKDKVPGSVYDPFLLKRLGAKGYVEDTWKALDAYVKRAVRKANMDPALEQMKEAAKNLEITQLDYVKTLGDRINMRPTDWDTLLDNNIKQLIGYKLGQRPTNLITSFMRKLVYRGALGLNLGSAIKNLTQGVNTFAKLGPINTLNGYVKLLTPGSGKELEEMGILRESFIEDRTISATKQLLQKVDTGLFYAFQLAEKINRGSAYYGAKYKALRMGVPEMEAIEYAKKIVRDTQFVFGSIDTAVALQGDIAKTLTQFGSFSVKQTEFLAEMLKNKEYAGLVRYILGSLLIVYTVGEVLNIKGKDFNPTTYFIGQGNKFGNPPSLALPIEILKSVLNVPDQYGKQIPLEKKIDNIRYAGTSLIPGGVQISKILKGNIIGNSTKETKSKSNNVLPSLPKLPSLPSLPKIKL
jgi:hypothetical protein